MYTLLLIGCILALSFCPLLLDAMLTWKETRRQNIYMPSNNTPRLTLATHRSR